MTRRALAALALFGACALRPPTEIPLQGPAPRTVLLLPPTGAEDPEVVAGLAAATEVELRARGYQVLPAEVGFALLAWRGVDDRPRPADELAAAARALGADAFFTLQVGQWQAGYAPTLVSLSHDLGYQLWSAADGALLWELRSRDAWDWREQETLLDHEAEYQAYLGERPLAQPGSPYGNTLQVALVLHRRAFAQLPAARR